MTDPPRRHSTIAPPPDRDRKTDPPLPTDKAPPQDILDLSEIVGERLNATDSVIADMLVKVNGMHELLMGVVKPDGTRVGSLIDALHNMNNHLSVIALNSDFVVEKHREYVNEVARVHQENVKLKFAVRELEARIERIDPQEPGTNGNGPHK